MFRGKVKPNLLLAQNIELMAKNKKKRLPVMICSNTDPYQPLEEKYLVTRKCIEVLARYNFPLMIFTKSHLITRDLDVLKKANALVVMTVTTMNPEIQRKIEPAASTPNERLAALKKLSNEGVKTAARIDPIIPMLNDDEKELTTLVKSLAETGIKHVTVSTLKTVTGFFPRLYMVDPELHATLRPLYMKGKLIVGYRYLPENMRKSIIAKVRNLTMEAGLTFGSCREGFPEWNTAACDGANYL